MTSESESTVTFDAFGDPFKVSGHRGEYVFDRIANDASFYEADLLTVLAGMPFEPDPGIFVDGGANIGNHSLFFSKILGMRGIAVEPIPLNVRLLRRNLRDNGMSTQVSVHEIALWDTQCELASSNPNPENSGTYQVGLDLEGPRVPATTLDSLVGEQRVALIKLDLEGAEPQALAGSERVLGRDRPIVVVEVHEATHLRDVLSVLSRLGYRSAHIGGLSDNFIFLHDDGPLIGSLQEHLDRLHLMRGRRSLRLAASHFDSVVRPLEAIRESVQVCPTAGQSRAEEKIWTSVDRYEEFVPRIDRGLSILEEAVGAATHDRKSLIVARDRIEELEAEVLVLRSKVATAQDEIVATRDIATAASAQECDQIRQRLEQVSRGFLFLSDKLAAVETSGWNHSAAQKVLEDFVGSAVMEWSSSPRLLHQRSTSDRVRIGIATMPGRESGLERVLSRLSPQADEVMVYLNGMTKVPENLSNYANVHFFTGPDEGDRGKFLFMEGFNGYYLTADDDIDYPHGHVDMLVAGIEKYGREAIVGWHGSVFLPGFTDYYSSQSRRVLAYYSNRASDTAVHLVGTGACGFHMSTLGLEVSAFHVPNMADVWLAIAAQEQSVPMVVLAHEKGWIEPIDRGAPSISNASIRKEGQTLDVRATVTETVKQFGDWRLLPVPATSASASFRVAIVGRTDIGRWKKGGILKSTHLMASSLRRFGVEVQLHDVELGDGQRLDGFAADAVIVYVGDPERPDFASVESMIAGHLRAGRCVIVNFSIQGSVNRSAYVARTLLRLDGINPGHLRLMVFTNAARLMPGLEEVRHMMLEVPKTLEVPASSHAGFDGSQGVFIGDIAKLSDRSLVGGPGSAWVESIRASLPGIPIYGVQQYKPRFELDFELDEVWSFQAGGMADKLKNVRLMVAPTKFATYEMVPMEVAGMGIPVIYREMPQSLSETLGGSGLQLDSPEELMRALPLVYWDRLVWRSMSRAGSQRANSQNLQSVAGLTYLRLKGAVDEVAALKSLGVRGRETG